MLGALSLPNLPEITISDWQSIKDLYSVDQYPYIHLNSGSAGIMPKVVEQQLNNLAAQMNQNPPYELWDSWAELRYKNKKRLGNLINAKPTEIAQVKNTTEAINFIVFGYPFQKGERILYGSQEYPFAVGSVQQLHKKYAVGYDVLPMDDIDELSDEEIIERYKSALKPETKLLLISLITFREGRILPIKAITEVAHSNGTEVLLDAAHAYAHFSHDVKELDIDYYATSLHKWLSAPHGTGLLYMKAEHIHKILPPIPAHDDESDIVKFSNLGTRPFQQEIGVSYALTFQDTIGFQKKTKRLYELTEYWTEQVSSMNTVRLHTPIEPSKCGAVASFSIAGKSSQMLSKQLMQDYGIHAKPSGYAGKSFVRVSPNLFTLESDLNQLVKAIDKLSKS